MLCAYSSGKLGKQMKQQICSKLYTLTKNVIMIWTLRTQ